MTSAIDKANGVRLTSIIAEPFWPVHRDIKRAGHDEYWLEGGRGSTKSSFISIEIIKLLIEHPQMHAIIYRRVGNTLRESVYEQIIWAIDQLGLHDKFHYRVSPLEIRYKKTGQRIIFRGADDPNKSKSIKISFGYFGILWFEELAEFGGMDEIRTIKASIIRGGDLSYTFFSYNPPMTARNWVNKEALVPKANRLTHHSTYLGVPREWLGKVFIAEAEALKASNERAYRHMYLGEVTGTGGQVFNNLSLRTITTNELNLHSPFYNGLDFGFAVDPDAYVCWAYDKRTRRILAVKEFYGSGNSIDKLAGEVHTRAGSEYVRSDSADPRMIAELQNRNVYAIGVKKGPGSVEHGVRWLQNLGEIVIDPKRTPNIAKEFSGYEYAVDKNGDFLSEYPDKDNHTIDATRYALETVIGYGKVKAARRF